MAKEKFVIAFDVDGCLVGKTPDGNDEPIEFAVNLFLALQKMGHTMIAWSGGGIDYAVRWAERLGLGENGLVLVAEKTKEASKRLNVDIAVDDEEVKLGKTNVKIEKLTSKYSYQE